MRLPMPPSSSLHRWTRAGWIATFAPICAGFLIAGVLSHRVFLGAAALWLAALGCVLRFESLNYHDRSTPRAGPRRQLAKAGWLLLALALIFSAAGMVSAAFA